MLKRILCLLLCLTTLLSVALLTGCSDKDDDTTDDESESPVTLGLYLISEKKVYNSDAELQAAVASGVLVEGSAEYKDAVATKAAYDAVEAKINNLTKARFKTQLNITFLTEDEYEATVDAALIQMDEAAAAAEAAEKRAKRSAMKKGETYVSPSSKKRGEETFINADGIEETKYPDIADTQIDIFYVSGYDRYVKLIEDEHLATLDSELEENGKKLFSSIASALLEGVQYDGSTYAIPNNNALGEYTYMAINKELFDKYKYNIDTIGDILDLDDFFTDVKNYEDTSNLVMIDSDVESVMQDLVYYWNIDPDTLQFTGEFSLLGTVYNDITKVNRGKIILSAETLLSNSSYRSILSQLMGYKYEGFFGNAEEQEGATAVVTFVKGNELDKAKLEAEGYYVVVTQYPHVTESDIFDNMFAITKRSSDISKSMEIVAYLNTDSEIRNLLQYGIEGENYKLTENGLKRLNNLYMMDISKTGNEFIAYPEEGVDPAVWETFKTQNREALVSPLFGFSLSQYLPDEDGKTDLDTVVLRWMSEVNKECWSRLKACETYEEFQTTLTEIETTYSISRSDPKTDYLTYSYMKGDKKVTVYLGTIGEALLKQMLFNYDPSTVDYDEFGESAYTIYYNWVKENGYDPSAAK